LSISITSGSNPACAGSSVTFTAVPVNGGLSPVYQWMKNAVAISGETGVSYTTTGLANADNITCVVTSSLACASPSTATSGTIIISLAAMPVANAGIDQDICSATANLAATVPSAGTGQWTLISGGGNISNNTNAVSGLTSLPSGDNIFRWTVSNSPCAAVYDEVLIHVSNNPSISNAGPDQFITLNSTNMNGNIPSVGNGVWTSVSGGGFISSVDVNNTMVGGLQTGANVYSWTIQSGACPSSSDQVTIYVGTAPSLGGGISGPATVQENQTFTYSVPANAGTTFNWSVPPGAVITGQGTNVVSITFGVNSGNVSVTATNPFGTDSGTLPVSVGQSPVIAGITGPDSVTVNSTGVIYSVPDSPGSTFIWTLPSGAFITSGDGTHSITVTFGTSGGDVSVTQTNIYGSDQAALTVVTGNPPSVPSISGTRHCQC
jgi:hypothetical protein